MRQRLALLGALLVIGGHSFAESDEDCVAAEPAPAFSEKSKGVKDYKVNHDKSEHYLTETFALTDGTTVKIGQGGCEHLDRSATFNVSNAGQSPPRFDAKFWFTRALELLDKLPRPNKFAGPLAADLNQQKKALLVQSPKADGKKYVLYVTDKSGFNTVRLEVLDLEKTSEISIGVNTAL